MIDTHTFYRPGLAAIAAVLALSSTPVIAQVTLPADPVAAAPAAPVMTGAVAPVQAPVQTVQSVPATPALPDIAVADTPVRAEAPARTAAARTIAPRTAETPRPAQVSARTAPPAPAAPVPVERSVTPAQSTDSMAPETVATPMAEAPVARDVTPSDSGDVAGWALIGGGLLLVGGAAAFALSRRPKRRADAEDYIVAEPEVRTVAPVLPTAAVAASAPTVLAPAPVARDIPADDRRAALEAMVAEGPSEANPFHSRRNRLRRADFLLRTGQATPRQGEYVVTEERVPEPAGARDRWSEMRFLGRDRTKVNWKPVRS